MYEKLEIGVREQNSRQKIVVFKFDFNKSCTNEIADIKDVSPTCESKISEQKERLIFIFQKIWKVD